MSEGKTLGSMTVDIGFKVDKRSQKDVKDAFSGIRSDAIMGGAGAVDRDRGGAQAYAAASQGSAMMKGGVLGAMTMAAMKIPRYGKVIAAALISLGAVGAAVTLAVKRMMTPLQPMVDFSRKYGLDVQKVHSLGLLTRELGGSNTDAMSDMARMVEMRDRLRQGDAGWIANVAKARIDPQQIINAPDAQAVYINVLKQMAELPLQWRRAAASSMGLSDISIKLSTLGVGEIAKKVEGYSRTQPISAEDLSRQERLVAIGSQISAKKEGYLDAISRWAQERVVATADWVGGEKKSRWWNSIMPMSGADDRSPAQNKQQQRASSVSLPKVAPAPRTVVVNFNVDGHVIKKIVKEELELTNQIAADAIDYWRSTADATAVR